MNYCPVVVVSLEVTCNTVGIQNNAKEPFSENNKTTTIIRTTTKT